MNEFNSENKMMIDYLKSYINDIINYYKPSISLDCSVFNTNNTKNNVVTELAELIIWFIENNNKLCNFHEISLILILLKCIDFI